MEERGKPRHVKTYRPWQGVWIFKTVIDSQLSNKFNFLKGYFLCWCCFNTDYWDWDSDESDLKMDQNNSWPVLGSTCQLLPLC